jgi:hypothetical protein
MLIWDILDGMGKALENNLIENIPATRCDREL